MSSDRYYSNRTESKKLLSLTSQIYLHSGGGVCDTQPGRLQKADTQGSESTVRWHC